MASQPKNRNSPSQDPGISELEKMELETLGKVSRTLSTIENAIALYDASEEKPEDLKARISRLKIFHEKLSNWEREMLIARTRKNIEKRYDMLEKFVDVCHAR